MAVEFLNERLNWFVSCGPLIHGFIFHVATVWFSFVWFIEEASADGTHSGSFEGLIWVISCSFIKTAIFLSFCLFCRCVFLLPFSEKLIFPGNWDWKGRQSSSKAWIKWHLSTGADSYRVWVGFSLIVLFHMYILSIYKW